MVEDHLFSVQQSHAQGKKVIHKQKKPGKVLASNLGKLSVSLP